MKPILLWLVLLQPATPVMDAKADDLAWMTGRWEAQKWGGVFEETWSTPRGGTMLGHGRLIRENATAFMEAMSIEKPKGGILTMYIRTGKLSDSEAKITPFVLSEIGKERAVFVCNDHGFPDRIEYVRKGVALTVTLTGKENNTPQKEVFDFKRAK